MRATVTATDVSLTAQGVHYEYTTAITTTLLAINFLRPVAIGASPSRNQDSPLVRNTNAGGRTEGYR